MPSVAPLLQAEPATPESAAESPDAHHAELRLWLRLLTCTTLIEGEVRRRLRERFSVTLPRFDLMAQLDRVPQGLTLGELSRRLMVSNGNVTGLVERLAASGHVQRLPHAEDRRVVYVRLTDSGRDEFTAMARAHADWIAELFEDVPAAEREALTAALGRLKRAVRSTVAREAT
ncbi:MAG: MarR family transcriptional regulator [Alphaproteobacteria bacterium]|nr:MarR family transcriptional regulator [Alphaproteobacteria bacterium]